MKQSLHFSKIILALLVALIMGTGITNAQTFNYGNLKYTVNADGTTVTVVGLKSGVSASGSLVIPSTASYNGNTYTVTTIGDNAFYGHDGFTGSLTIPNTVTSIGKDAFSWCEGFNGSLTIPNSVTTIGKDAFYGCLGFNGTLTIGNSVTSIGKNAFLDCMNLMQINYNAINCADVTEQDEPFGACRGLFIIGDEVQRIPANMFHGCMYFTGSLTIPNSVTTIGDYAFQGCSGFNGSLTIGNSVTSIGKSAFGNCSGITQVNYNATNCADVTINDKPFMGCGSALVIGDLVRRIPAGMFLDCSGFTGSLTIPGSVTSIGAYAFAGCSGFDGSLTIPNLLTAIGDYTFYDCNGFTGSLTIPNTVTTIGNHAFRNCNGFTGSLTIPNSVTSIGDFAFKGCSGFTGSLTIPNSVTSIGDSAFEGCSGFTGSLTIPSSVTTISDCSFSGCSGFTGSLTIPNSVTTIGYYAFCFCNGFTGSLNIPNSVTTIGDLAFMMCNGFDGSLTIPSSVISIGMSAFEYCSGFKHVKYNAINCADVTITAKPFFSCGGSLVIGSSVQRIPAYMFQDCSSFTGSLTIPNTVTAIGEYAFSGCSGFTGSLTIPNSVTSIGNATFRNCSGFTGSLIIPNSVTSVGEHAFCGCSGLNDLLSIPNSVMFIGNEAFENCSGLSCITVLPATPITLGTNAFLNVPKTIPVYVPCESKEDYQNASGWSDFTNMHCLEELLTYSVNVDGVSATVTGHIKGTAASGPIIISETVTINGNTYTVTAIGDYAFFECEGLTGFLTIPNTVTAIGEEAFYGCAGFDGALTIGNSVTTIGEDAFHNCSGFTSMMVYPVTPPTLGTDVFYNVPTDIPVYVPCNVLEDYQAASGWNAFTNMQCFLELTVFDGTVTNSSIPANIIYFDEFTRSQFVIPANVMAGMTGATLYSMTFYTPHTNVPYTTVSDADVYLKEVDYTSISAYEPKASATTVYSGRFSIVSAGSGGEMTISFDTPYTYQGGNLLVGVENTETNGWKEIGYYGQTVEGASISGLSSTGTIPAEQQNFIPKTTFSYIPGPSSAVTQTIALAAGANYVSFNVETTLVDLQTALTDALGTTGVTMSIKSQTQYTELKRGKWTTGFNNFNVSEMFIIKVSAACEIMLTGASINPAEHPVTMVHGANWIAYPLSLPMTITNVFTGFVGTNDALTSQTQYSKYTRGKWSTEIELQPGQGYIYGSAATGDRTFIFPISK